MAIKFIAATDLRGYIGKVSGRLPWGSPIRADMERLVAHSVGHVVVTGRTTHDLIGTLPNRRNIVLTRNKGYVADIGTSMSHDPREIIALAEELEKLSKPVTVFILGGAVVYEKFLPYATSMILTIVHANLGVRGDVRFPEWDRSEWQEVSIEHMEKGDTTPYDLTFLTLDRIAPAAR